MKRFEYVFSRLIAIPFLLIPIKPLHSQEIVCIDDKQPILSIAPIGESFACAELEKEFKLQHYLDNISDTKYYVDFGDGKSMVLDHNSLDASGTHIIKHTYYQESCNNPLAVIDQFILKVDAIRGCVDEYEDPISLQLTVGPFYVGRQPVPNFLINGLDIGESSIIGCINSSVYFDNVSHPGIANKCKIKADYKWDFGDGNKTAYVENDFETKLHEYTKAGTYKVKLTVDHSCGIFETEKQIEILEFPNPIFEIGSAANIQIISDCQSPPATYVPDNLCAPVSIPLKHIADENSTEIEWKVTSSTNGSALFSNNANSSSSSNETVILQDPGIYTIELTASNACGLTTSCVSVTIPGQGPDMTIVGLQDSYCDNDGLIDFSTPAGDIVDIVSWGITGINGTPNPTNLPDLNTENPSPIDLSIGEYQVNLTKENSCTRSEVIKEVKVHGPPVVAAGPDQLDLCNTNTNVQITGFSPAGGIWTGTGIVDPNLGIFNPGWVGPSQFPITYTYTDVNGCTNSDIKHVQIVEPLVINAGVDEITCFGTEHELTGFSPAGGTWTVESTEGEVVNNAFTSTNSSGGFYALTYTFGEGSCQVSDTKFIEVRKLPHLTPEKEFALCHNDDPVILAVYSEENGVFTWSSTHPEADQFLNPETGVFDPRKTTAGSIIINVSFTENDDPKCTNDIDVFIEVNPLPTIEAGPDQLDLCDTNTEVQLTGYVPEGGIWTGSDGIVDPNAGIFNPGLVGVSDPTPLSYTYTDINGCANSDIKHIQVIEPSAVYAGVEETTCFGIEHILTGFSPAGGAWTVEPADGEVVNNTFTSTNSNGGFYSLTYTFGVGSCQVSDRKTVEVKKIPTLTLTSPTTFDQHESNAMLTILPSGGTWSGQKIQTDGTLITNIPGMFEATYVYQDQNSNCENSATFSISIEKAQFFEEIGIGSVTGNSDVYAGDIDGDGLMDLFANSDIMWPSIYINDEDLGFQKTNLIGTRDKFVNSGKTLLFDIDQDQLLDVYQIGQKNNQYLNQVIISNNGYEILQSFPEIIFQSSSAINDIDNDGDSDIVISGSYRNRPSLLIYKSINNADFYLDTVMIDQGVIDGNVILNDVDHDNDLDLIVGGNSDPSQYQLFYFKNFDGRFVKIEISQIIGLTDGQLNSIDLNNDGFEDFVVSGSTSDQTFGTWFYLNNQGNLKLDYAINKGVVRGDIAVGDLDNDLDEDIILNGLNEYGKPELIFLSNSNGVLAFVDTIEVSGLYNGKTSLADLDNDHDLDVVVSGITETGDPKSYLLINNMNNEIPAIQPIVGLNSDTSKRTVQLSWSRTANARYNLLLWKDGELLMSGNTNEAGGLLIPYQGNLSAQPEWQLNNLSNGYYEWKVFAIDKGFNISAISNKASFVVDQEIITSLQNDFAGLKLYPNPVSSTVMLQTQGQQEYDIKFMSLQGRELFPSSIIKLNEHQQVIDIRNFNDGIYIFQAWIDGIQYSKTIIKK